MDKKELAIFNMVAKPKALYIVSSLIMKAKIKLLLVTAVFLSFMGCSKSSTSEEIPDPTIPNTGTSVETNPPNTKFSSAFTGQTRINGVRTTTAYNKTILTSSLNSPWGITSLPDGRLLITEKSGSMRIVTTSGTVGSTITGIPAVNSGGQGGLLGVCVDPQFSSNRMVYWVFSENVTGGTVTSVAKGRLSNNETSFENITTIYRANPAANSTAHYGGRILFDATGNVLVSTGERSNIATRPLSQSV